jgi:trigger factor
MQIQREQLSPTSVKLIIKAGKNEIESRKASVVKTLGNNVKVPGFRSGKAPAHMIEKQIDPNILQSEFLQAAVSSLYEEAIREQTVRVVAQPEVEITKFVPYETLEFSAIVEAVGEIKMPDYKKMKLAPKKITVVAKDINEVVDNLLDRSAEKKEVKRVSKNGDQTTIDFSGVDTKTKEPISGTDGKDYPLTLGSKAFIPGFEEQIVGMKAGDEKTFTITFPEDYSVETLKKRKVDFTVKVNKVEALTKPKADDEFAKSVGPFKDMTELKADVKKQLEVEKQREADQAYDNEILDKIGEKTTVAIPDSLIEEDVNRIEEDEKRNIVYRGQTWQEHLDAEKLTAEQHREKQKPIAIKRVKSGLILGEIAQQESLSVSKVELDEFITHLKTQYTDPAMLAELNKPDSERDLSNRLMIEKTLAKIREYTAKPVNN